MKATPTVLKPAPAGGAAPQPFLRKHRFFNILLDRWWIVVLTIAAALCVQAYLIALQPPLYSSIARMWVSGKIQVQENSLYREELQNFFGTQIELMQSDKIL